MGNQDFLKKGFVWLPFLIGALVLGVSVIAGGATYVTIQRQFLQPPPPVDQIFTDSGEHSFIEIGGTYTHSGSEGDIYLTTADGRSVPILLLTDAKVYNAQAVEVSFDSVRPGDSLRVQGIMKEGILNAEKIYILATNEISVPGMSKYTDSDFGFSFWYPNGWNVKKLTNCPGYPNNPNCKEIDIMPAVPTDLYQMITLLEQTAPKYLSSNEHLGVRTIYFEPAFHTWMERFDDYGSDMPGAAHVTDVSINTMGGLHMINGGPLTTVVPLSAHNFVSVIGPNLAEIYLDPTPLTKTILATDLSVATPVSVAEQIKIIQAERDAYEI
jgi:hypothetical protein